jgi:hypothetical protein
LKDLTPLAVRTGLAFNLGKRIFLKSVGTAAMMSTSLSKKKISYEQYRDTPSSNLRRRFNEKF